MILMYFLMINTLKTGNELNSKHSRILNLDPFTGKSSRAFSQLGPRVKHICRWKDQPKDLH